MNKKKKVVNPEADFDDVKESIVYGVWREHNIGCETYFKSINLAGIEICISAKENRIVVHACGREFNFSICENLDTSETSYTTNEIEEIAILKGAEVLKDTVDQYIVEARRLGVKFEEN